MKDDTPLPSPAPMSKQHLLHELHFKPGDMRKWPNIEDIEIFLTPRNPWTVNFLPLDSVDVENGIARTKHPGTYPLSCDGGGWDIIRKFYQVENAIDYLDGPGRWVLDSTAGKLYLWPRTAEPSDDILAPVITELVSFSAEAEKSPWVHNIIIDGLTFCHGDRMRFRPDRTALQHDWEQYDEPNAMVRLRGAENITIKNCRFCHGGGSGVRLDLHAVDNNICQNEISEIGGTGIVLAGYGPGTRDENHHNQIYSNHVHHCARLWWHSPGIFLSQSGHNRIANNLIHHLPYNGMVLSGVRTYVFDLRMDSERRHAKYGPEDKALYEGYTTIRFGEIAEVPIDAGKYEILGTPANVHSPVEGIYRLGFMHSRNNTVENNEIHHVMEILGDGNGVYVSGVGTGNVIRRNFVHDIEGLGGVAAIRLDDETYFTLVTENVVWRTKDG